MKTEDNTLDFDMGDMVTPIGTLTDKPLPKMSGPTEVVAEGARTSAPSVYEAPVHPEANFKRFLFDTKPLAECLHQAENLRDLLHSDDMALKVIGILSYGLRRSGELMAETIYQSKMAKSVRKQKEAMAALSGFGRYVAEQKANGIEVKVTDTTRAHYVAIDVDVLAAVEREAFYEAVESQLETYKTQMMMVMSSVKAVIGKNRGDQISSLDSVVTADPDPTTPQTTSWKD